ncbi:hypothetical protein AB0M43_16290 [Longispora sp. NPDC051575]|uniref:hypothetical protein n=1 Tax=Longispora sp. NPDC051575 TaxID=3154943 RepID=UPI0034207858
MSTSAIPRLLQGLIDDAAVFPPGNAPLPDAIVAHRAHRSAWYAPFVGPLLLPVGRIDEAGPLDFPFGAIGGHAPGAVQVELPWSPSLLDEDWIETTRVYAEISRASDWRATLDTLVGTPVTPKFRTGGLSPDLFPSIGELAAIISACRTRGLRIKLTAGLHHAARHTDPATGFTHHGFLNILAACLTPGEEAFMLEATEPEVLADVVRPHLFQERPLWVGFGTCSVTEPLEDILKLGLVEERS